jgi:pyrroloquinoline quinone (PQQ) biosynthesis protein C
MDHESFTTQVEDRQRQQGYWLADQPFVRGIGDGSLTEAQIVDWIQQFFVTITRVMRSAHSRPRLPTALFSPDMKRYMWENRVEEEFGALSNTAGHVELLLRLAETFGLSRLDMAKVVPSETTAELLAYVEAICHEKDVVSSQIMLGFFEAMMPEACERLAAGFQTQYDRTEDDVQFFSVHIFADEEHGDIAKRMVALVPEEQLDELADIVLEYTRLSINVWGRPVLASATSN